jgi:steroid delta-isomerase-like uncharacterized protein
VQDVHKKQGWRRDLAMPDSVTQRFVDAWNSLDPERVADLYAEDGTQDDVGMGGVYRGREAIKAFVAEAARRAHRQFVAKSEQVSGERYAVEWESTGTITGELSGTQVTNMHYQLRGASVGWFDAEGKIVENRDYYNPADLMRQLRRSGNSEEKS